MRVPDFLARQFYVSGSLRNRPDGFELQATNGMGDGVLVGIGPIEIDGYGIDPRQLSALRSGGTEEISAARLDRANPIQVRRGDRVTIIVRGPQLPPGKHELRVRLVEQNIGPLEFKISDKLTP